MNRLILAAVAFAALTLPTMADPVKLATEGAYPPFNYVDDNGNVGGFDVELGNELCLRAGLECSWVTNEWDTIIANLAAGNYDAIIADLTITDERRKTIDFTQEYFPPDPSTFLSRAGTTFDYGALKGVRIGAQTGTIQAGWLGENLKADNTILTFDIVDQAVADLNAGNVDLVLAEGSYVGEQVAGSNGALKADGPKIPIGQGAGIGLRKGDTELRNALDDALEDVKADGWLDALIVKYFPDLGPGPFFGQ
jgi:polar amino acid transport system substrate-binding protein